MTRRLPPARPILPRLRALLLTTLALLFLPRHPIAHSMPDRALWQDLTNWVGSWRGVGQPKRGSSDGAWTETASWSWDFTGQQPALVLQVEKGKYVRQLTLQRTPDNKQFELLVKPVGDQPARKFTAQLQEDGALVATTDKIAGDFPERLTIRSVASGDRLIMLLEKRASISDRFNRLAEVGYTRQGSDFGKGTTFVECVVTGGLGTIAVQHEGQTYYVCCAGCRDLFLMKPAEIIAEYRQRKKEAAQKDKAPDRPDRKKPSEDSVPPPNNQPSRSAALPRTSNADTDADRPSPCYAETDRTPPLTRDSARAAGLRQLQSRYLTLYTDLPDLPEFSDISDLPRLFDLAVPQWCQYFQVPVEQLGEWRITGYLMKDPQRFRASHALPEDLPPFLHGYQRAHEIWLYEQSSSYYRRHLLLHEGTHAFMATLRGGIGKPWFAEGLAELLGTHRWQDDQLQLAYVPRSNDEVPLWGRVKILQEDYRSGQGRTLNQIFQYDDRAHRVVEPYGWCWAAALFFDRHPATQLVFRRLARQTPTLGSELAERLQQELRPVWLELQEDWQLLVAEADYGYDVARAAIVRQPTAPLPASGGTVKLVVDRGWQSTGWQLTAGQSYRIRARGRYQIAQSPEVWECEPNGITLTYHQQMPAGIVQAAIRPDQWEANRLTPLARPISVGLERILDAPVSGTLYIRINEPSGRLADNRGDFLVRVEPQPAAQRD